MGQFHRPHCTVRDESGPEPRSQPKEEHQSTLVTAQSLHGRIIHDFHRTPKSGLEVKPNPARGEIMWLQGNLPPENQPRVANRDHVILPISGKILDSANHLIWRHCRPGGEPTTLTLPGGEDLDARPADINDQYVHGLCHVRPRSRMFSMQYP